jgi:O-methyltransferase involved in polyketide biosynthesis
VAQFDPSVPSIARIYDYVLGGKDNFPADRAQAEQALAYNPLIPVMARENRQFLSRAVGWMARQGIDQFIDIGCGLPTTPNTHESARAVRPEVTVAYVDNDPVVLNHLNALVAKGNPGIGVLAGDVREPDRILDGIAGTADLARPAGLILGSLLHFIAPEEAQGLVARYAAALAAGSYLVISAARMENSGADGGYGEYSKNVTAVHNHSAADFARFLGPLELVPPGIADARRWHPSPGMPAAPPPRDAYMLAAVAQVTR